MCDVDHLKAQLLNMDFKLFKEVDMCWVFADAVFDLIVEYGFSGEFTILVSDVATSNKPDVEYLIF